MWVCLGMSDDLQAFAASMKLTQVAFILGRQIASAFIIGAWHNKLLFFRQRPVFYSSNFGLAIPLLPLDCGELPLD